MRRFLQLFLLASLLLLLPTFLYLSHSSYDLVEYRPGRYAYDEANALMSKGQEQIGKLFHPPGQFSQGKGPIANGEGKKWYNKCLMNPKLSWSEVQKCMFQAEGKAEQASKESAAQSAQSKTPTSQTQTQAPPQSKVGEEKMKGNAIMPKLGNATAKAELGRATWKFLHTMTLRFPEEPTDSERRTLKEFIHLFSLLYPCGDCANHFQQLLKELPPQTGSRKSASLWLCSVHNRVNARLGKPEFDCSHLDENYDCGCGIDSIPSNSTNPLLSGLPKTMSGKSEGPKRRGESLERIEGSVRRSPRTPRGYDWLEGYRDVLVDARAATS